MQHQILLPAWICHPSCYRGQNTVGPKIVKFGTTHTSNDLRWIAQDSPADWWRRQYRNGSLQDVEPDLNLQIWVHQLLVPCPPTACSWRRSYSLQKFLETNVTLIILGQSYPDYLPEKLDAANALWVKPLIGASGLTRKQVLYPHLLVISCRCTDPERELYRYPPLLRDLFLRPSELKQPEPQTCPNLYRFKLFSRPLSPAHWPWPKLVTCPLSSTRFDPILTTVGQTNIKKLPNLGLIVTIYSRWPIAKFRPCCPLSPPRPNNSKWYSITPRTCYSFYHLFYIWLFMLWCDVTDITDS